MKEESGLSDEKLATELQAVKNELENAKKELLKTQEELCEANKQLYQAKLKKDVYEKAAEIIKRR